MSASVSAPWAIVVPNGDSRAARSASTWIHWWSRVIAAKACMSSWVIDRPAGGPKWSAGCTRLAAVEEPAEVRGEVVEADALHQEGVGAGVQRGARAALVAAAGEHHHARLGVGVAYAPARRGAAVAVGQAPVEQHDVGRHAVAGAAGIA